MTIGKEFLEKTKEKYFIETDQEKGLPRPALELEYDSSKKLIELPKPAEIKLKDKEKTITHYYFLISKRSINKLIDILKESNIEASFAEDNF